MHDSFSYSHALICVLLCCQFNSGLSQNLRGVYDLIKLVDSKGKPVPLNQPIGKFRIRLDKDANQESKANISLYTFEISCGNGVVGLMEVNDSDKTITAETGFSTKRYYGPELQAIETALTDALTDLQSYNKRNRRIVFTGDSGSFTLRRFTGETQQEPSSRQGGGLRNRVTE